MMASPFRVAPESSVLVGEVGDVGWGPGVGFSETKVSLVIARFGAISAAGCEGQWEGV